jgi:hypothetical protein
MDFMTLLFVAIISVGTVGNGYGCITDSVNVAMHQVLIGSRTGESSIQAVLTPWQGRTGMIQAR